MDVRDLLCVVAGDLDNGPAEDAPVDLDLDPVRAGMDSPDRDVAESVFAREANRLARGQVPDGQLEHLARLGAADALVVNHVVDRRSGRRGGVQGEADGGRPPMGIAEGEQARSAISIGAS